MPRIHVIKVSIPAMSTLGYGEGYGWGECDQMFHVRFVGDHRLMRDLGQALAASEGEPPVADVPAYAITFVQPVEEGQA